MERFTVENLEVSVSGGPVEMGKAAADFVAEKLNGAILQNGTANLILATGASQFTFLDSLQKKEVDWKKITVFHLDEYKGISDTHPASFRKYLKDRILDAVAPKEVYFLNGDVKDLDREIQRYEEVLKKYAIDVACIGIGENGHLAFNDPPVADFQDPKVVKVVQLDDACRNQQLREGWFPSFQDVPTHALTLTIPAILRSRAISCVVPDARKARAVHDSLYGPIRTACPGSILRTHPNAVLFLDVHSAKDLGKGF